MASNPEYVQYIADQLGEAGQITYRKMFGEYGMYVDGKIFAVICDNQLFIKITEAPPYEGAKNYLLVEDIDDQEALVELVKATSAELPAPKPKKPKKVKEKEHGI